MTTQRFSGFSEGRYIHWSLTCPSSKGIVNFSCLIQLRICCRDSSSNSSRSKTSNVSPAWWPSLGIILDPRREPGDVPSEPSMPTELRMAVVPVISSLRDAPDDASGTSSKVLVGCTYSVLCTPSIGSDREGIWFESVSSHSDPKF